MFDTPASSSSPPTASKRRFLSQAMDPSSSPSTSRSTPYSLPRYPSTCSPWAFATPHDSPSNPFGLNRSLRALTLPRPTGFGKHIVLRMQLVSTADVPHTRGRHSRRHAHAPYRIVQVPLNFSFRLLHMLILFLFASDARLQVKRKCRVFSPPSPAGRKNKGKGSDKDKDDDKAHGDSALAGEGEGHLFEVLNGISVTSMAGQRPGQVMAGTGRLYARLSSARERKLFPDPDDDDEDDVFAGASTKRSLSRSRVEDEDEEGWDWEAEDDFLLSNVWPEGLDLKQGIIYHHTPSTLVHITVNQSKLSGRKGSGNTPHVFSARGGTLGAVRITNVSSDPIPPSDDEKENKASLAAARKKSRRKARTAKDRHRLDDLLEEELEDVSDLSDLEDASDDQLERWNEPDAFQRFLKREAARERAMRKHPNLDAPPSPIRTSQVRANHVLIAASSPLSQSKREGQPLRTQHLYSYGYSNRSAASSSGSLAPSSPSTLPIILPSSDAEGYTSWSDADTSYHYRSSDADADEETACGRYSIELPLQTPFPAHPAARRRIGRVCKRLERQTSEGLEELSDSEEEDEDAEEAERRKEEKRRARSPSEDATARRAAVEAKPLLVRPVPAPPVIAAEGPDDVFGRRHEGEPDSRDEVEGKQEEEESAGEEDEANSEDEGWEIGSVWGLGPIPPDWDSEEEV